jgi:hypothetical protein
MREERLSFDCGVSRDRAGNSQHGSRQVGNRQIRNLRVMLGLDFARGISLDQLGRRRSGVKRRLLAVPRLWTCLDDGIGFGQIRNGQIRSLYLLSALRRMGLSGDHRTSSYETRSR